MLAVLSNALLCAAFVVEGADLAKVNKELIHGELILKHGGRPHLMAVAALLLLAVFLFARALQPQIQRGNGGRAADPSWHSVSNYQAINLGSGLTVHAVGVSVLVSTWVSFLGPQMDGLVRCSDALVLSAFRTLDFLLVCVSSCCAEAALGR